MFFENLAKLISKVQEESSPRESFFVVETLLKNDNASPLPPRDLNFSSYVLSFL